MSSIAQQKNKPPLIKEKQTHELTEEKKKDKSSIAVNKDVQESPSSLVQPLSYLPPVLQYFQQEEEKRIAKERKIGISTKPQSHTYLFGKTADAQVNMVLYLFQQELEKNRKIIFVDTSGKLAEKTAGMFSKENLKKSFYFNSLDIRKLIGLNILQLPHTEKADVGSKIAAPLFLQFLKRYFDEDILTPEVEENIFAAFRFFSSEKAPIEGKRILAIFRVLHDKEFVESEFPYAVSFFKSQMAHISEKGKQNIIAIETAFKESILPLFANSVANLGFQFHIPEQSIMILDFRRSNNAFEDEFLFYSFMTKLAVYLEGIQEKKCPEEGLFPSLFIHDERGMLNFLPDFSSSLKELSFFVVSDGNKKNLITSNPYDSFKTIVCSSYSTRYSQIMEKSGISEKTIKRTKSDTVGYMCNGEEKIEKFLWKPLCSPEKADKLKEYSRLKWGRKRIFVEMEAEDGFPERTIEVNQAKSAQIILKPDYWFDFHRKMKTIQRPQTKTEKSGEDFLGQDQNKLLDAEKILAQRVIGQTEAVQSLAARIRTGALGFKVNRKRPNGVYFFLGPTGVGKTELAKALAELLFEDEEHLIRFDMSEFYDRHTVANLIGSPKGYVGHDEGGELINKIIKNPKSVILFDEIEKAHHSIFHTFLQLIDEGRLTDGKGRTGDFSKTYIIFTSNCGHELLTPGIGFLNEGKTPEQVDSNDVLKLLSKRFSPEFIGRMDKCIFFRNLDHKNLLKICDLKMESTKKILHENGVEIMYDKDVLEKILEEASKVENKAFITRQIQGIIFSLILEPLAKMVLINKTKKSIKLTIKKGQLQFIEIS